MSHGLPRPCLAFAALSGERLWQSARQTSTTAWWPRNCRVGRVCRLRRGHRRASPAAHCRNPPTRSVTPTRLLENSPNIVIVRSPTRGRVFRRPLVARCGPRPSLVLRRGRQLQPFPHHGDGFDAARTRDERRPHSRTGRRDWAFEYFFGFLASEVSQYEPHPVHDTTVVAPSKTPDEGYHLSADLPDDAINWARKHKALQADRPCFMYWTSGCLHGPHHIHEGMWRPLHGKLDDGWDATANRFTSAPSRRAESHRTVTACAARYPTTPRMNIDAVEQLGVLMCWSAEGRQPVPLGWRSGGSTRTSSVTCCLTLLRHPQSAGDPLAEEGGAGSSAGAITFSTSTN